MLPVTVNLRISHLNYNGDNFYNPSLKDKMQFL